MKWLSLIIGCIILAVNVIVGLLVTAYATHNVEVSSAVIVSTFLLIYAIGVLPMQDAFKVSLSFMSVFFGVVEFVLGVLSPCEIHDNWYLIAILILVVVQLIIVITSYTVSSRYGK